MRRFDEVGVAHAGPCLEPGGAWRERKEPQCPVEVRFAPKTEIAAPQRVRLLFLMLPQPLES